MSRLEVACHDAATLLPAIDLNSGCWQWTKGPTVFADDAFQEGSADRLDLSNYEKVKCRVYEDKIGTVDKAASLLTLM